MNIEEVSEVAMQVISYAGSAKSLYLSALQAYKNGDEINAIKMLEEGDESALIAHKAHTQLLHKEMSERESQATLLMIHAEDQLMNAETIKILVEEIKVIYTREVLV